MVFPTRSVHYTTRMNEFWGISDIFLLFVGNFSEKIFIFLRLEGKLFAFFD